MTDEQRLASIQHAVVGRCLGHLDDESFVQTVIGLLSACWDPYGVATRPPAPVEVVEA